MINCIKNNSFPTEAFKYHNYWVLVCLYITLLSSPLQTWLDETWMFLASFEPNQFTAHTVQIHASFTILLRVKKQIGNLCNWYISIFWKWNWCYYIIVWSWIGTWGKTINQSIKKTIFNRKHTDLLCNYTTVQLSSFSWRMEQRW